MTLAQEHRKVLAQCYTAAWRRQDPASLSVFFSPNHSLAVDNDDLSPRQDRVTEVGFNWVVA